MRRPVYNDKKRRQLKQILIFDGDCGVCNKFADYATSLGFIAISNSSSRISDYSVDFFETTRRAYLLEEETGRILGAGHEAIGGVLQSSSRFPARTLGKLLLVRKISPVWKIGYWIFANFLRKKIKPSQCGLRN